MSRIWTLEEKKILTDNWNVPMKVLVSLLPDRNRKTIYYKLNDLGFFRETYRRYTLDDDAYLIANYKIKGNYEMGRFMKRTSKSISKRMIILGLKRVTDDFKELAKSNKGCFKVGKISERKIANGNLRLSFDDKSNRNFYDIKINEKFVRLSRYLYENFHSVKLGSNDVVFHLDGDSMNVLKENLVLITRSELLNKNIMTDDAFIKRIFRIKDIDLIEKLKKENPEIISLKRNIIKLNQKVNKQHAK